jgi:hypothetical protein
MIISGLYAGSSACWLCWLYKQISDQKQSFFALQFVEKLFHSFGATYSLPPHSELLIFSLPTWCSACLSYPSSHSTSTILAHRPKHVHVRCGDHCKHKISIASAVATGQRYNHNIHHHLVSTLFANHALSKKVKG